MIDNRIVPYLRQTLTAGYKISAIKDALSRQGYSSQDIDDTIKYVSDSLKGRQMSGLALSNKQYAGFWVRVSAFFWDMLIIFIPMLIIYHYLFNQAGTIWVQIPLIAIVALFIIYMEGGKGGTPGKLLLGLRITNEEGNNIGILHATVRYASKLLSTILLLIGYFMIGWTEKKQGLHDKIAKSYVVKEPGKVRKGMIIFGFLIPILLMAVVFIVGLVVGMSALYSGLPQLNLNNSGASGEVELSPYQDPRTDISFMVPQAWKREELNGNPVFFIDDQRSNLAFITIGGGNSPATIEEIRIDLLVEYTNNGLIEEKYVELVNGMPSYQFIVLEKTGVKQLTVIFQKPINTLRVVHMMMYSAPQSRFEVYLPLVQAVVESIEAEGMEKEAILSEGMRFANPNIDPGVLMQTAMRSFNNNPEEGLRLYLQAYAYARYDVKRVPDESAHQAISAMQFYMAPILQYGNSHQEVYRASMREFVEWARVSGPPQYHPDWMINHGMEAMTAALEGSNANDALNPVTMQDWTSILDEISVLADNEEVWKNAAEGQDNSESSDIEEPSSVIVTYAPYESSKFGMKLRHASSWAVEEAEGTITVASPPENSGDWFRENIQITIQDISDNPMTIEDYVDLKIEQLEISGIASDISVPKYRNMEGEDAYGITYTWEGEATFKISQTFQIRGNTAYIITFTAIEDVYEKYKQEYDYLLLSLRFPE